jgi:L-alanine-DL-glutamate epimerase-like enolase superfamily enzyme
MKITKVRAFPITTKLDKVYWTSRGAWASYNMILVKVETDEGLVGYGQINKTPLKEIAEVVEALEEVIAGMDALAHEAVWQKMLDLTVPHIELGKAEAVRPRYTEAKRIHIMAAIGGIDIALWDIKGKAANLPLWRLLGGERREVPAYASGGYYEEGYSPLAVIDEMASYVAQGYMWSLNRLSSVRSSRLIGGLDFRPPCGRCQLYLWSQMGSSAARQSEFG